MQCCSISCSSCLRLSWPLTGNRNVAIISHSDQIRQFDTSPDFEPHLEYIQTLCRLMLHHMPLVPFISFYAPPSQTSWIHPCSALCFLLYRKDGVFCSTETSGPFTSALFTLRAAWITVGAKQQLTAPGPWMISCWEPLEINWYYKFNGSPHYFDLNYLSALLVVLFLCKIAVLISLFFLNYGADPDEYEKMPVFSYDPWELISFLDRDMRLCVCDAADELTPSELDLICILFNSIWCSELLLKKIKPLTNRFWKLT